MEALRALSKRIKKIAVFEFSMGQMLEDVILSVGERAEITFYGIPGGIIPTPAEVATKTWSKPARGDAKIAFDGEQLTMAGRAPERNPVIQARAQSAWLKGVLTESTGRNFDVFPVVVFPGWFIEQSSECLRNIWVLEPKALAKFLANAPQRLEPDEVKLASFHLSRFIRTNEQDRGN